MHNIRKSIAVLIVVIASVLAFGACSSGTQVPKTVSTVGAWVHVDGDFSMAGEVKGDTIVINMKLNDSEGLYWAGSFPTAFKEGDVVTSKGNQEQLKSSLFGSSDAAKEFKFVDGKLTFPFTMMGVTKTIELTRV